ncbi:MAG: hypothetical protein QOH25_3668 [Acidobacteriota bacterium]|jgi:hypothetical protein|nr:hypothetical protein [Acidobacteriota bacterium]
MKRIAFSSLVIFVAIATSFAQTTPQQAVVAAATSVASAVRSQPKRLASIRSIEATEGSRVIITSDASLGDYQAFADSGRFYVLIPSAVEPTAQNELRGHGFTDAQIERRGEDVMLSFGLEAGAGARVNQRFNRLEVLFSTASAQEGTAKVGSTLATTATPTPTPTPTPATTPSPSPVPPETKSPSESTTATTVPAANAASPQTAKAPVPVAASVAGITLPPEKASPVRLTKFDKAPVIDGKLDDAVWQNATVLKDFYQIDPGDNTPPLKPTEVLLGYDAKTLYLAFRAFDEPDKVRATVAKRDNIFSDDYVGFYLDTFNDKRKAFEAFFNPLGIQADGVLTEGRGEDFSVDWVMDSKGLVNQEGYIVEIAIPFKSLRYAVGKDKLWGAHFFRRIKRNNNELDSWMPFSRSNSSNMSQAGHLTGFDGISTERQIELIPSLTISETGRNVRSFNPPPAGMVDPGRIVNDPIDFDPGLTAKFGISPTATLDLALNPDFAQVEADQIVVTTNQRFPIFFPEKRPFFLEGIDIFQTPILAVHTRAIVDPDVALKFSGKQGRNTFGIMVASDNGPGNLSIDDRGALNVCRDRRIVDPTINCNSERFVDKNAYIGVLRLKRDIGKGESTIGMLATTYNFIEKHNQLGGFDGRFRINKQTTFDIQVLGTTSRNFFYDPVLDETRYRTGNGFAYTTQYDVSGRNWGWQLYGEGFTKDYRADVGFFGRQNTNYNSFYVRYNSDPKSKAKILSTHYHNFSWIGYDFQGRIQNWESEFYVEWRLRRNSWFSLGWEPAYERILEEEFGPKRTATRQGAFFGDDDERSVQKNHIFIAGGSQFNKKIQFNGRAVWRFNHLDLDFGGGRRFPRVSPAALLLGEDAPLDPGAGNLFEFSGGITYQPTNALKASLNLVKNRLVRKDTGLVAFDTNIFTLRTTYQFSPFTFARAIVDYNTLNQRVRGQFLLGWTPNPGTALYVGYNDDLNYGFNQISREIVPGFRRNGRTFFIKMSYLIRKSF